MGMHKVGSVLNLRHAIEKIDLASSQFYHVPTSHQSICLSKIDTGKPPFRELVIRDFSVGVVRALGEL